MKGFSIATDRLTATMADGRASPSRGNSKANKAEKSSKAYARRQMTALAAGFAENTEIPSELSGRLTGNVMAQLQRGIVVDVGAPEEAVVEVEAHATTEHLEFQATLVARTALALPAFERDVREQELRARTQPFELGEENRRLRKEDGQGVYGLHQDRNAALADELDALTTAAENKNREAEEVAMALEEVSQQFDATTIKRQYTNARVDAMDQMQQTLDGACEAQDDEAATLVFMKDRIEDYLRTSLPSPQRTLRYAPFTLSLSLSLTRTAVLCCVLAHCAILQARSVRVRPH